VSLKNDNSGIFLNIAMQGGLMKRIAAITAALVILSVSSGWAADVGFNVNLNIGNRAEAAPVYVDPQIGIAQPPEFILPPALGFYVAIGVPYDMVFVSNVYYLHKGNVWYRAPRYDGPWVVTPYKRLPPGIRKHRFEKIRYYRDEEYRRYRADEGHYRGHHFRPEKERKEFRKEERREMKEDKKREKEQRKENKKWEKEQRKQEKHGGRD
jgi:hypothetical protein